MDLTLYRAADDDIIVDTASFSASLDAARAYLQNPGFGGRTLYRVTVTVDEDRVLDLYESSDPIADIMDLTGRSHPGAIGADEWVPRISDDLRDSGIEWVRVRESFPADTETWIFVGPSEAEPEMEELA